MPARRRSRSSLNCCSIPVRSRRAGRFTIFCACGACGRLRHGIGRQSRRCGRLCRRGARPPCARVRAGDLAGREGREDPGLQRRGRIGGALYDDAQGVATPMSLRPARWRFIPSISERRSRGRGRWGWNGRGTRSPRPRAARHRACRGRRRRAHCGRRRLVRRRVKVVAVEPEGSNCFYAALEAGAPVTSASSRSPPIRSAPSASVRCISPSPGKGRRTSSLVTRRSDPRGATAPMGGLIP